MSLTCIHPGAEPAVFRSRWLMISPDRILENHCLETVNHRVAGISQRSFDGGIQDLGPGLIMPLLVNAHTHLELSALNNRLDYTKGFEAWVKELLIERETIGPEALAEAASKEIDGLMAHGTGAVGEISTLGLTADLLNTSDLGGIWFNEVLGSNIEIISEHNVPAPNGRSSKSPAFRFSMAGHAPHTTSPELLCHAKKHTAHRHLPFSIHLAESQAESDFINGENRGWAEFLMSRGIDISGWPVGNKSPVAYLDELGILDETTLAVHLIRTSEADLDILARTRAKVCLCPRSNHNLHKRLPDIEGMLARGLAPALGTDSLASCDSLSLFDEMAFVREKYPGVSPGTVLSMAGINGAQALGLAPVMGRLEKKCWAGFLYVDLESSSPAQILESLTVNEI